MIKVMALQSYPAGHVRKTIIPDQGQDKTEWCEGGSWGELRDLKLVQSQMEWFQNYLTMDLTKKTAVEGLNWTKCRQGWSWSWSWSCPRHKVEYQEHQAKCRPHVGVSECSNTQWPSSQSAVCGPLHFNRAANRGITVLSDHLFVILTRLHHTLSPDIRTFMSMSTWNQYRSRSNKLSKQRQMNNWGTEQRQQSNPIKSRPEGGIQETGLISETGPDRVRRSLDQKW